MIRLRSDKTIQASGDDLNNYFILSKVRGSGAAGPRKAAFSEERHRLLFSLTALGMGDHNAVDVNQAIHEALLANVLCTVASTVLRLEVFPRGDTFEGAYSDDHLSIQSAPRRR
jgi:hypothetical protein